MGGGAAAAARGAAAPPPGGLRYALPPPPLGHRTRAHDGQDEQAARGRASALGGKSPGSTRCAGQHPSSRPARHSCAWARGRRDHLTRECRTRLCVITTNVVVCMHAEPVECGERWRRLRDRTGRPRVSGGWDGAVAFRDVCKVVSLPATHSLRSDPHRQCRGGRKMGGWGTCVCSPADGGRGWVATPPRL